MARHDYRRLVEVGPFGHIALEVSDAGARAPISVDVSSLHVELDEHAAGELFDALAGAIGAVIEGRASAKLHAADTPPAPGSAGLSDPSGKVLPRGDA